MYDKELINQIDEFTSLWHRLLKISENDELKANFKEFYQLSANEISIINIVSENQDVILGDICASLDLPKSTLTNTINRLEKKGYLHRTISKKDLRSYGLSLTEKGIKAQNEHVQYESLIFGGVLQSLETTENREDFLRLLKIMTTNLEKMR